MTKDLALLVGPEQKWLSTTGFLDKVDANLKAAMSESGVNLLPSRISAVPITSWMAPTPNSSPQGGGEQRRRDDARPARSGVTRR